MRDADGRPLAVGDHVYGDLRTGRHVAGRITSIRKGGIVVMGNDSEGRKRSGRSEKSRR